MHGAFAAITVVERGAVVRAPADASQPAVISVSFDDALARLDALADEWAALGASAAEPNAFAEQWFAAAALPHLANGEVRIAEVREDGALIGLLPLTVESGYGRVPVRFVQNWRHSQSFLGAPLVRTGKEAAFWSALIEGLDGAAWAPGFLHVRDLVEHGPLHQALRGTVASLGRPAATVYREVRAFLCSPLAPDAYYAATVRKKKRKELARLRNRLAELGPLATRTLGEGEDLDPWCDAFLALERAGWKGREGSALACHNATECFFRAAISGARAAGRLEFLALELDRQPIAMLVNFLAPPGSFSFKTAFDESYARFSPGVLLQLDNFRILAREDVGWMDSCAAEQHPMIDSLWGERRALVRVTVPLSGGRRRFAHAAARTLENLSAATRRRRTRAPQEGEEA